MIMLLLYVVICPMCNDLSNRTVDCSAEKEPSNKILAVPLVYVASPLGCSVSDVVYGSRQHSMFMGATIQ